MKRKILSIFALLLTVVTGVMADTSGSCGTSLTWKLTNKGVLTISGTGAMFDYDASTNRPTWQGNDNVDITCVVIENGVTTIGAYSFYNQASLNTVTIASTVTAIGSNAFNNCEKLETIVVLGNTPATLDDNVFDTSNGQFKISVPNSCEEAYKKSWTTYSTKIYGMSAIDGSDGADMSGDYYSYDETNHVLTISGVGEMPDFATASDRPWNSHKGDITTVVIGKNVTRIGNNAFFDFSALTSVVFENDAENPSGLKSIGSNAFASCYELTTINLPSQVEKIEGGAFALCTSLANVTIPDCVASIGASAFHSCFALETINIPAANTTSIGALAFGVCSALKTVTIGSGVNAIGPLAFDDCPALQTVTIKASVLNTYGNQAFDDTNNTFTMYVPATSLNSYQTNWETKKNQMGVFMAVNRAKDAYWATYYNNNYSFTADENTTVYTAALSTNTLNLSVVNDRVIPSNNAVILKSSADIIWLTPASTSETFANNSLQGTTAEITGNGTIYVLNYKEDKGVGFYKLRSGKTLSANKAYLVYPAAAREYFLFDETTDISAPFTNDDEVADGEFYDLQGRRVAQPTRGFYIVRSAEDRMQGKSGKKIFIK